VRPKAELEAFGPHVLRVGKVKELTNSLGVRPGIQVIHVLDHVGITVYPPGIRAHCRAAKVLKLMDLLLGYVRAREVRDAPITFARMSDARVVSGVHQSCVTLHEVLKLAKSDIR